MSGNKSEPTIEVDIFKELINDMTNQLNTNLVNLNTKVDNITKHLHNQQNLPILTPTLKLIPTLTPTRQGLKIKMTISHLKK